MKSKTPNKTSTVRTKLNTGSEIISDFELDKVTGGFSSGGDGGSGKITYDSGSGNGPFVRN
jgi:hypothetical protein